MTLAVKLIFQLIFLTAVGLLALRAYRRGRSGNALLYAGACLGGLVGAVGSVMAPEFDFLILAAGALMTFCFFIATIRELEEKTTREVQRKIRGRPETSDSLREAAPHESDTSR